MANTDRPMTLKFSFEETVWFRKGDEIQELINLSLEPNVTIQQSDHFITIQGSLELNGEYQSRELPDEQEEMFSFTGQKFANVLETGDTGICEFSYHFPVDISIPKTRVKKIEEIDLRIDSFDYRIVENNCLEVSTDLFVTGVYNEIPSSSGEKTDGRDSDDWSMDFQENEQYYNRPEADSSLTPLEDFENESFDISVEATKREKSEEVEEEKEHIPIQIFHQTPEDIEELTIASTDRDQVVEDSVEEKEENSDHQPSILDEMEEVRKEKETDAFIDPMDPNKTGLTEKALHMKQEEDRISNNENYEPVDWEETKEQAEKKETVELTGKSEGVGVSPREVEQFWQDTMDEDPEELEKTMAFRSTPSNDEHVEQRPVRTEDGERELNSWEDVGEEKGNSKLDRDDKNIHYQPQEKDDVEERPISLTEYFARKEETKSTRMTAYIVQEDDQLSDIAEKYNIQISQLLRINRLDSQHEVYEGQVLLIPQKEKILSSGE